MAAARSWQAPRVRGVVRSLLLAGTITSAGLATVRAADGGIVVEDPSGWTTRTEWSTVFTIAPGPYDGLRVAEARNTLFALGRSGRTQPAIWFSADAEHWTQATVPEMTEHLGDGSDGSGDLAAHVVDVVDAGDRLIGIASVGLADGSGLFGTMIYASTDGGRTWSVVSNTPGTTSAAMFDVERFGALLIAAGTAIWTSNDGGLTCSESVGVDTLAGAFGGIDAGDRFVVAAGDGGNGDLSGPPAQVMRSTDGNHWERVVIDPEAGARSVAIGPDGRVIVGGDWNDQFVFWASDDGGTTWDETMRSEGCCASDLAATPTGYVAASSASFDGARMSRDGITWTSTSLAGGLDAVAWGPRFGLAGANATAILLGPDPAPILPNTASRMTDAAEGSPMVFAASMLAIAALLASWAIERRRRAAA